METKWSKSKFTIDYHFHWWNVRILFVYDDFLRRWWICVLLKSWGAETNAFIGYRLLLSTQKIGKLWWKQRREWAQKQTRKRRRKTYVLISGAELRHFVSWINITYLCIHHFGVKIQITWKSSFWDFYEFFAQNEIQTFEFRDKNGPKIALAILAQKFK